MDLTHTVLSLASENLAERVRCNTCGSEHRFLAERSAPRIANGPQRPDAVPSAPPPRPSIEPGTATPVDLIATLRDLLDAAGAFAATPIGSKWAGGTVILKPGRPGLQEKEIPIDSLFRKIVMVRDRLRVLEQHINASEKLSDAEKLAFQQYITRCYGSLTTFNVLFDARDDWFVGEKKSD